MPSPGRLNRGRVTSRKRKGVISRQPSKRSTGRAGPGVRKRSQQGRKGKKRVYRSINPRLG